MMGRVSPRLLPSARFLRCVTLRTLAECPFFMWSNGRLTSVRLSAEKNAATRTSSPTSVPLIWLLISSPLATALPLRMRKGHTSPAKRGVSMWYLTAQKRKSRKAPTLIFCWKIRCLLMVRRLLKHFATPSS